MSSAPRTTNPSSFPQKAAPEGHEIQDNIIGADIADYHGQPSLPPKCQAQADRTAAGPYDPPPHFPTTTSMRPASMTYSSMGLTGVNVRQTTRFGGDLYGGNMNPNEEREEKDYIKTELPNKL